MGHRGSCLRCSLPGFCALSLLFLEFSLGWQRFSTSFILFWSLKIRDGPCALSFVVGFLPKRRPRYPFTRKLVELAEEHGGGDPFKECDFVRLNVFVASRMWTHCFDGIPVLYISRWELILSDIILWSCLLSRSSAVLAGGQWEHYYATCTDKLQTSSMVQIGCGGSPTVQRHFFWKILEAFLYAKAGTFWHVLLARKLGVCPTNKKQIRWLGGHLIGAPQKWSDWKPLRPPSQMSDFLLGMTTAALIQRGGKYLHILADLSLLVVVLVPYLTETSQLILIHFPFQMKSLYIIYLYKGFKQDFLYSGIWVQSRGGLSAPSASFDLVLTPQWLGTDLGPWTSAFYGRPHISGG